MTMRPFRFRPAAVLELRRREEEAVRDVMVRAEAARLDAETRVRLAGETLREAVAALRTAESRGVAVGELLWHRTWIHRKRLEVEGRRQAALLAAVEASKAAVALREAVQRRRVLEKLRDRAWRRYAIDATRAHAREMDEVASLRAAAATIDSGGSDADDHTDNRYDDRF